MKNPYQYEELGIVVMKQLNKRRVIFLIVLLILLIVITPTFIYVLHINNKMVELEKEQIIEDNEEEVLEEEIKIEENKEEKVERRLPQFTENAKQNINNIYKSEEKIAYLTFDDGPSTQITPQILTILDNYNIKATFFVLGVNVERYPELVREEYNKGHYIANHGYTHIYDKIYSSVQAVIDEYNQTEQSIKNALDLQEYSSHLFRFPGGSFGTKYRNIKSEAKQLLEENNIAYVDWNALTNDSVGNPTEESIMQNLVETVGTKNCVVILMHDASTKQLTANKLPEVIEYLQQQGYTFKNFYSVME